MPPSDMYPNLAGTATQGLVEQIPGNGFRASYINWARTVQMLREHAPGWLPYLEPVSEGGGYVHQAPKGGFLLIGFEHPEKGRTPVVPQAVMDTRNNAIPYEAITARDVSDTHRRGICLAAAMTFGLAYELWAKMPLESGFRIEGALSLIQEAETLDELYALVPAMDALKKKEKDEARIAYLKREKELEAEAGPQK